MAFLFSVKEGGNWLWTSKGSIDVKVSWNRMAEVSEMGKGCTIMSNDKNTLMREEDTMRSCTSVQELVNCKEFYGVLEKFCNLIFERKSVHGDFLNLYFNDEGYVDIWRIPHLMIDAVHQNLKLHQLMEEEAFRHKFHSFLAEMYDYCLMEIQTGYPETIMKAKPQEVVDALRARQAYINSLTDIFIQVMESVEKKGSMEMSA